MTSEADKVLAEAIRLGQSKFTREQVGAVLRTWARENPPRRFALCGFIEDEHGPDCELLAWGLGFEDHAIAQSVDSGLHGRFKSAESARQLFGIGRDVELVWVDAPAT
ncbi:hypothetical protein [Amycolatopsis sp. CA-230715]|uniref:hypothetical protein n=1 Tax=Amycolatopsis sp. CA-230715 TaxID=2745196 RepID=UPI001C018A71|nr:hypothetical protein [Amycolatopsis sp. CA-230715]QWF78383.1 hypothetical protein HUW46_01779 [Amycolatopsis sp. CA-230715]